MEGPVLITGANGFIGRRLTRRLLAEGTEVHALVLPNEPIPIDWEGEVIIHRGDVTQRETILALGRGKKKIFHLAAVVSDWGPEALYQQVTVGGTQNVLDAALREGAQVVLASSIIVYGNQLQKEKCHEALPYAAAFGRYSRKAGRKNSPVYFEARYAGRDHPVKNVYSTVAALGPQLIRYAGLAGDRRKRRQQRRPGVCGQPGGPDGAGRRHPESGRANLQRRRRQPYQLETVHFRPGPAGRDRPAPVRAPPRRLAGRFRHGNRLEMAGPQKPAPPHQRSAEPDNGQLRHSDPEGPAGTGVRAGSLLRGRHGADRGVFQEAGVNFTSANSPIFR
ncbi:MAG: NAD-dependent epimerase/dehydratase family protein [Lewinellaceae bacterium]|nr:NAD-dependent epimerase/dehydratase family protein [Lewinellaceae bacterium]